ncbi:putative polysaccharide biosynthesis protein [Sediminibacillus massiliensis]|uniref:putative polysaccharide biosynthesis protein n=1 Tax=Sediminibacillus massiliensis TaxID=1926277 RepID=UPI0009887C0C|nr:polysaccharide biosynthesis protein [Sediminibacillus massiliensis]
MATSNILRGTMLLTGATFLSKFLGMIYVIPFNELVGAEGGDLYQYAYVPYNILLSVSTVGVPLAVSRFVSKYNSLEDYETGRRMFKAGMSLMMITGFIGFLILFFGASVLARLSIPEGAEGTSVEDVTFVIRMVSFALIIIPSMSIVRGFFQGYQSMGPTAISQVIEQIVRIIFLLVSAYLVMNVFGGQVRTAVGFSTFAAFVGAAASCLVLLVYWRRRKKHLDKLLRQQKQSYNLPIEKLFRELFRYAGPFILVGLATSLYQLVDQMTFKRIMVAIGEGENAVAAMANINFYGHKLVIIPVTLATGMSLAILPAITNSFTAGKKVQMFGQMNQALQIIVLLILPAAVGMSVLSYQVYAAFYGLENIALNGMILRWYAPVALCFAFFTVSASILQGINKQNFTVISLSAGVLMKIIFNFLLIYLFGARGAVLATMVAVTTVCLLNLWKIKKSVQFSYRQLIKRSMLIAIFTTIMGITVWVTKWLLELFLSTQDDRLANIIVLIICVAVGMLVYLWLGYQSTLLERVLGNRVRKLDKILDKLFRRK